MSARSLWNHCVSPPCPMMSQTVARLLVESEREPGEPRVVRRTRARACAPPSSRRECAGRCTRRRSRWAIMNFAMSVALDADRSGRASAVRSRTCAARTRRRSTRSRPTCRSRRRAGSGWRVVVCVMPSGARMSLLDVVVERHAGHALARCSQRAPWRSWSTTRYVPGGRTRPGMCVASHLPERGDAWSSRR